VLLRDCGMYTLLEYERSMGVPEFVKTTLGAPAVAIVLREAHCTVVGLHLPPCRSGLLVGRQGLVVLAQAAVAPQLGEGPLD